MNYCLFYIMKSYDHICVTLFLKFIMFYFSIICSFLYQYYTFLSTVVLLYYFKLRSMGLLALSFFPQRLFWLFMDIYGSI